MVYTFLCAHSHLEMQLNDITLVVSDAYAITNTNLIPPKMANTDIISGVDAFLLAIAPYQYI